MSVTFERKGNMQVTIDLPDNTAKTYQSLPQESKKEIADDLSTMIERKQRQSSAKQQSKKNPMLEYLEKIEKYPVVDLPEDASVNLDHYLYGTPKRS